MSVFLEEDLLSFVALLPRGEDPDTLKTGVLLYLIRSMVLGLYGYDIGEGIFFLSRLKDYL